jgi:hypothetical protein
MNRALLLIGLLSLICSDLFAQTGNYFLSHYSPTDEHIDFRSRDMVQDSHGEIYFANRAGVLEFDGFNWKFIEVPGAVYTMVSDGTEVLIGGLTGAGKLNEKIQSPRSYEVVSDTKGIFSSVMHKGKAYFCSEDQLLIYTLQSHQLEVSIKASSATGTFTGVFTLGEEVVVDTEKNGLFNMQGNTLVPYASEYRHLLFTTPSPSGKNVLVGTKDNRLFIQQENDRKEIVADPSDFFSHHILSDGVWVSDSLLAVGTLRGGVIFINVVSGATESIVDYNNGLPDNEVFSLMRDKNEGVWVAHEYGFTRIATNLPFQSFHTYPGLLGNLLCMRPFQDRIYVGTSLGLFILTQKTSDAKGQQRISFEYERVAPIKEKVNQLLEINGSLIAYGAGGLFEINGQSAKLIIDEPVRSVLYAASLKQMVVSTFNDQLRTFLPSRGKWTETHLLDTLDNHFSHMFEDNLENIWLCGSTLIYKVETVDNEIIDIINFPIQNPTADEVLGLSLGNEVYVISSGQFNRFNGSAFVKYDSLSGGHRYFASAGNFWFNDGTKWRTADRKLQSMKLEWLGIFPGLRFISPGKDPNSLWTITDKNELYKFTSEQADSGETLYPLFLREVRGTEIKLSAEVEIEQSESAFTFEFIRPDYIGTHANQYRYLVKGLNKQWSSWSASNNVINFSYLPAGAYQLIVQSKNALGAVAELKEINFQVLPPYWKSWWFYALEFVVFSFFVSLSIHLARRNSKYRYLSQILTILTVIMLIQFIQTTINSLISLKSTPVIDFFIQVSIALLVFPVEIVARNTMQKVVHNKYSIQRLFNDPKD